ncbi:hypothetical protein M316_0080 [Nitrincola phage 1M3-16]|uniref:hypothetical protein n=1 Tax=Nitrincola phage 1M3-16 TaxID=1472912 RepID=UPI000444DA1D|nr:hypothetical protein GJ22_gp072 [Nitrincola phage 1M3-16]AHX01145.1 hypothetical protein M316_0080 [Nitrincola phage 1M3-16]
MKKLHELGYEEYEALKKGGMLWEVFPEATGNWYDDTCTKSRLDISESFASTIIGSFRTGGIVSEGKDSIPNTWYPVKIGEAEQLKPATAETIKGEVTPVEVMYDSTQLRIAVEFIYEHNHHTRKKYPTVDAYENYVMTVVGKFIPRVIDGVASSTSTYGMTILSSWLDHTSLELEFLVNPAVCSDRYSHYVSMQSNHLIDFIKSFAEDS